MFLMQVQNGYSSIFHPSTEGYQTFSPSKEDYCFFYPSGVGLQVHPNNH